MPMQPLGTSKVGMLGQILHPVAAVAAVTAVAALFLFALVGTRAHRAEMAIPGPSPIVL